MELNVSERTLALKIVYYGPALGGKTTNLRTLHALTDRDKKTELVSIATRDDRTLFFDLLPLGLGRHFGFDIKLKLYTVPGQAQFDVTRRKVLSGADAVVLVLDSQQAQVKSNELSAKNLRVNLIQNAIDPKTLPIVLQFNKRDLPGIMSVEEMRAAFNETKFPSFPAVAIRGDGVLESLASAATKAIELLATGKKLGSPADVKKATDAIRSSLLAYSAMVTDQPALPTALLQPGAMAADPEHPNAAAETGGWANETGIYTIRANVNVSDDVDLLEQAVAANLSLTDRMGHAFAAAGKAARREGQVRALAAIAKFAESGADPEALERHVLHEALSALSLTRGSFLVRRPAGDLRVIALAGHEHDPLAAIASPPLKSVAERLIATGLPRLCNDLHAELAIPDMQPGLAGVTALLFAPLRASDGSYGGIFVYGGDAANEFDTTDELFLETIGRIAALAHSRAPVLVAH